MQIEESKKYNYPETYVVAYDDNISKSVRSRIRERIEKSVPFYEINEDEDRKAFSKIMASYAKYNIMKTQKPNTDKVGKITWAKEFEPTCYRGGSLYKLNTYLKDLKNSGITNIISLSPDGKFHEEAEKEGLNLIRFKIGEDFLFNPKYNPVCMTKQDYINDRIYYVNCNSEEDYKKATKMFDESYTLSVNQFIEKDLIPFIKTMQNGKVYLCCSAGIYRTDIAVILNSWFNSEAENRFIFPEKKIETKSVINIYNNLSEEHKKQMSMTQETREIIEEIAKDYKD